MPQSGGDRCSHNQLASGEEARRPEIYSIGPWAFILSELIHCGATVRQGRSHDAAKHTTYGPAFHALALGRRT